MIRLRPSEIHRVFLDSDDNTEALPHRVAERLGLEHGEDTFYNWW